MLPHAAIKSFFTGIQVNKGQNSAELFLFYNVSLAKVTAKKMLFIMIFF